MIENRDAQSFSAQDFDVSIRPARFEQPDLIVRSLGRLSFGLYASEAYVAAHGLPNFDDGCDGHRLILGRDVMASPIDAGWLQDMTGRAIVSLKAASFETLLGAVASGYGIGALPRFTAEGPASPKLVRLAPATPVPAVELWLGVHRKSRGSARVRQVIDAAAKVVAAQERLLNPPEFGFAADPTDGAVSDPDLGAPDLGTPGGSALLRASA